MNTILNRGLIAIGCLLSATTVHAVSYADVGDGPFGSMSWVTRDYHYTSVTEYDGAPMHFLSSQSNAWYLSYADANLAGASSSSLLDGTLHVSANAGAWGPNATNYTSSYLAGAGTAMWDRITVGADEGTHLIPLRLRVDGAITDAAAAKVRYYVGPNDPFGEFAKDPYQGWKYLNGNPGSVGTRPWDTTFELGSVYVDSAYSGWPLNVYFEMVVTAYSSRTSGGSADFSHTARFDWDLPEGVTFESASGQFMTTPVPEPATWAMTLLGLALVPAARRRWARRGDRG